MILSTFAGITCQLLLEYELKINVMQKLYAFIWIIF
jgi:hypothetical protein